MKPGQLKHRASEFVYRIDVLGQTQARIAKEVGCNPAAVGYLYRTTKQKGDGMTPAAVTNPSTEMQEAGQLQKQPLNSTPCPDQI